MFIFTACNVFSANMTHLHAQLVSYIIAHQANMRIVSNIAKQYNLPEDKFLNTIQYLGNTGSASVLITLSEHLDKIKKNDVVGLTVFGGGYSCGSMLIKF